MGLRRLKFLVLQLALKGVDLGAKLHQLPLHSVDFETALLALALDLALNCRKIGFRLVSGVRELLQLERCFLLGGRDRMEIGLNHLDGVKFGFLEARRDLLCEVFLEPDEVPLEFVGTHEGRLGELRRLLGLALDSLHQVGAALGQLRVQLIEHVLAVPGLRHTGLKTALKSPFQVLKPSVEVSIASFLALVQFFRHFFANLSAYLTLDGPDALDGLRAEVLNLGARH